MYELCTICSVPTIDPEHRVLTEGCPSRWVCHACAVEVDNKKHQFK